MEHELKTWPMYFEAVRSGKKPFEIRENDRRFQIGDTLRLLEWDESSGFTGRDLRRSITYALDDSFWGISTGFVCLGLSRE